MMETYTAKLAAMNAQREELGEALTLFGLPIVAYPQLAAVDHSLKELQAIYSIYADFLDKREEWAQMLWADLELSAMEKGMEEIDTRIKKMPKNFKQLRPYKKVEEATAAFSCSACALVTRYSNSGCRSSARAPSMCSATNSMAVPACRSFGCTCRHSAMASSSARWSTGKYAGGSSGNWPSIAPMRTCRYRRCGGSPATGS